MSLTDQERARLHFHLISDLAASAAIIAIVCALAWASWKSLATDGFLDRGQLFVFAPVGFFWLWLFRRSPQRLGGVIADMRREATDTVDGDYTLVMRKGYGLIALFRPRAVIGGYEFAADDLDIPQHWQGKRVRAKIGAASKALLSVSLLDDDAPSSATEELTDAEKKRLALMAEGLADKLIARELGLSPATVRTYNSTLFKKLGAANREEAIEIAAKRGLIDVN